MTPEFAVQIVRDALIAAFWLSAPLLLAGFVIGVITSLVQVLTSIQDSAVATVPRLAAFLVATALLMPWMLSRMTAYATSILGNLGRYAH